MTGLRASVVADADHGHLMQRLPAGFDGKDWHQTDGAVYSVVEGRGIAYIEGPAGPVRFDFEARDPFVAPSWQAVRLQSDTGCVLFSFSDRPAHLALGLHKEERIS